MEYSAYLDIETTGLSPLYNKLTVVGIYRENSIDGEVTQMAGDEISSSGLLRAMKNVTRLYTYNGSRFDLPFIKAKLNVDLKECCPHEDLMYACWKKNLKGGLKSVERQLGIERELTDIDGWMAVQLWYDYQNNGDKTALARLLKYNEEDIVNLRVLRERLEI
ncbi:MAG: ribonuclease H-like domain-containing protein [Nitrospirota bacterium]